MKTNIQPTAGTIIRSTSDEHGIEVFTIQETGESGMSVSGLARAFRPRSVKVCCD